MENIVTINNTKENTFELNVSVQGLSTPDIRVWFTISANGMDICFACEREGSGDKWICTVPPLPFIDQTAYPCSLQVVGDGYYFEPFNGTLNVVGNAEIYSSTPKNVTIKPANRQDQKPKDDDKKDDKKDNKKSNVVKLEPPSKNKTKSKEKSIEQLAEELMAKNGDKKVVAPPKKKPLTPKAAQRVAAKKILKEEASVKAVKVAAKKSEKIDAAVKKISESAKKKSAVKKPVAKPAVKKPVEKKVDIGAAAQDKPSIIREEIDKEILKDIEKVVDKKKLNVKNIVENLTPKKKEARKETIIPPAELSKKLNKTVKVIDGSKEDVVKNILEGIGIKLKDSENSDVKIHTDVKRSLPANLNKGEVVVDIDQIARELMEKAKLDPKNVDKKLAAQKAEAAKKIEESDAPVGKKNDAVMAILEDLGVKPDGATKSVKISFIKKEIH